MADETRVFFESPVDFPNETEPRILFAPASLSNLDSTKIEYPDLSASNINMAVFSLFFHLIYVPNLR